MAQAPATATAPAAPDKTTITGANTPHLRVGLKWDPKEIDHLKFVTNSTTAVGAFFKIGVEAGFTSLYSAVHSTFMRDMKEDPKVSGSFKAEENVLVKLEKMREAHPEEFEGPSYNLDLLCFKYDRNKKLAGLVSPDSLIRKNATKAEISILHSGDDPDGCGVGFDEELLVTVGDIPPEVETIFFVVSSENGAFGLIKGGACAIIRTQDETELLHGDFGAGGATDTMVFASMRRAGDGWALEKLNKFIVVDADKDSPLDDSIDDILRNTFF